MEPQLSQLSHVSGVNEALPTPELTYWTDRQGMDNDDPLRRSSATGSDPAAIESDPVYSSHDAAAATDDDDATGSSSDEYKTTIL